MHLISKLKISNYKSFRKTTSFNLADGTYFVGINNSGKSTILSALDTFFNQKTIPSHDFINRISFLSKRKNSNISEITIEFDLNALTTQKLKQQLVRDYNEYLSVTKILTVATVTRNVTVAYRINDGDVVDELPKEIFKIINSVKVTYLHPQEGQALLERAQEKLKQRLLAGWGRGPNVTSSMKKVEKEWSDLRTTAKKYLSSSLTESLQSMWPDSEISINLPNDIRDIITISDINFSSYKGAPEIELTAQGTGAQSTILYLTHFILDSDRSLHQWEYHPLWLLEEPESFLHIDLLANLAKQLNSERWLENIQVVVSTHSPVLLAGSRIAGDNVIWSVLSENKAIFNKTTTDFNDDDVKNVGELMGDPNFFAYFLASKNETLIFSEDSKDVTIEKYIEAGIRVSKGLGGTPEIISILKTFISIPYIVNNNIYFIVDADKGKEDFLQYYEPDKPHKTIDGFKKFKVKNCENIYLIFLPEGTSCEHLFLEFKNHLDNCVSQIWDTTSWSISLTTPSELSGAVSAARKHNVTSKDDAIDILKNLKDIKSTFWTKVAKYDYRIHPAYGNAIKKLIV